MTNPNPAQISLFQDLAIFLVSLIAALALYFLARLCLTKFSISKRKNGGAFFSRLSLPIIILLIVFILNSVALPISPTFRNYLDAALIFGLIFLIIRFFDAALFFWYEQKQKPFPLPDVLHGLILGVIYLLVLFAVLKNIVHVNITPFLATSAILTMVLGLAFQGVLSNILAGMSLHFTKSFSRGDWVGIGPHEGVVVDTNWRETRIQDRQSNIIVLPNNIVASEKITNFSQPDLKTALVLPFKISYKAPAAEVLRALVEAAGDCPDVLKAPAPLAFITSYDDIGVSYLLKFWITDFARKNLIVTDVGRLAWYKLRRKNIEIAITLGDHVRDALAAVCEKPAGRIEPREPAGESERERTFLDLMYSSFLRGRPGEKAEVLIVSEKELRSLASMVDRHAYTKGEILFRQGDKGTSSFVVAKGKVRGEIVYEECGKKFLSEFTVGPGGIFGEMSLFTGMPRTATGIVEEESELLEITAEDFAVLLDQIPALAEVIAETVSARNEQNLEFLRKIKELSEKDIQAGTNKKSILEHLRSFVRVLRK
jgi:small-conductance mechanosensitive channel/CRP-like cAMP-binding protein